jgi:transaldolase
MEEINEINNMGFLAGVTTHPTLVAKDKKDYPTTLRKFVLL